MAMDESALSGKLLALFQSMHSEPMSEKDYADKLAKIITDHVKTAEVKAGISLTASGSMGQVTGKTVAPGEIE